MRVIATAGHVDHGKSTLVRLLTGMEPDRWEQERRRGLTLDLGFAWTSLPGVGEVAFVDVPGHERFVPTMLAGVGPAPAVLFVVAADSPWMPQAEEHLAAIDALGVAHGLLVVTRADLADPGPIRRDALARIARTSLGPVPSVVANDGIGGLRTAVADLVGGLPAPDVDGGVRLWVDRSFTVAGAGTVVTGTLRAGTIRPGDELLLRGKSVRVRGVHALGEARSSVSAVARVGVNLRGVERSEVERGDALVSRGGWWDAQVVDVTCAGLARQVVVHIGAAAVPARAHALPDGSRLFLTRPLPLCVGDRVLVRNPSTHGIVGGSVVDLDRLGRSPVFTACQRTPLGRTGRVVAGEWYTDQWDALSTRARSELAVWRLDHPLEVGLPTETLRRKLRLPSAELVAPLLSGHDSPDLPKAVVVALDALTVDLSAAPFAAPDATRLRQLGLGSREVAVAVRAGRLVKLADGVVLLPGSVEDAARVLAGLAQPFTTSQARQALGTSRRVALPLLALLDRTGVTKRLPDDTRQLR
ncbi:selenocysteine-specific translation elongation factor [Actinokineospora cianjurensis]|uniref:Selenocysteine-specific translation elongation factor SelB n=1 Tax=Actinokineospora cianjurensis TaxID=585224 RepID=A0A421B175_9PSEU|nr:selenocysteine-specific translation elongation factor [Actinokineospora cianjurensis]RLK58117.1 selenocysteine-specific translation elongation factor SelB [Actinokineospora cianjurensis]